MRASRIIANNQRIVIIMKGSAMWKEQHRIVVIVCSWLISAGLLGTTSECRATTTPATTATRPAPIPRDTNNLSGPLHTHSVTTAPTTRPHVTVAQIQHWINELTSHRYSVRHAAAKELLAAGDAAMPLMKKAMAGMTTPEMRHLLRQDMRKIHRADLLAGPLITLNVKDISAQRVFEMVCKQAGTTANFLNMNQGALPGVTIQARNAPFWKVMQKLAVLTGVSPSPYNYGNNQPGLQLTQNGALGRGNIVDLEGGFAIVAQNIYYNRSRNLIAGQGQQNQSQFYMQCLLLSIPGKMGLVQIQQAVISKVVDNHGNSLLTASPNNFWYGNQFGNVSNFSIPLQWPKKPGTFIKEVTGYIPATLSMDRKVVDLKFKAKGVAKATIGDVRIAISHRRIANGIWHFTYAIKAQGANPFNPGAAAQNIMNQFENLNSGNIIILSAGGRTLQNNGWSGGGGGPQGMSYTVNESGGKPAEIRFTVYTGSQNLKIPIHLKNIPMP